MIVIAYAAAITAAGFNASSSVLQRMATAKPDAKRLFSHRFLWEMLRTRLFILGFTCQVAGFIAQVIALGQGPLIVVEPLLTSELIFLLLIITWRLKIKIFFRDWLALLAIISGLVGLFLIMQPRGGHLNYQAGPWIILLSVVGPLIILMASVIRTLDSPRQRAMLAAFAASISFAMNAAFTKLALNLFAQYGFKSMLSSWPVYALIISGIISVYLMLNAFGAGPLAISQPIMEIGEPAIAVVIGIFIFGDHFATSIGALIGGSLCIAILVFGVVLLGSSPRILSAGEQGL